MEIAFDPNGYPYDTSTGLLVNLEYDQDGNAYDSVTGQMIDTVLPPDRSTVYKTADTPFSQIIQAISDQLTHAPAIGYYPSNYPSGYPGTYPRSTGVSVGVTGAASGAGAGIGGQVTLSKTTLLIGGVVLFAFLFGRKGK